MVHLTSAAELLRSLRAPAPVALFESMIGGAPSDGPLALAAELGRRLPELDLVWAGRRDGWSSLPWPELTHVEHGSTEHRAVAARARLVVTTHGSPRFLNRSAARVHLGHGIPLKKLGLANPGLDPKVVRSLRRRARTWTVHPSPSEFYDRAALEDVGVDPSTILRMPYARYDRLPDLHEQRAAIRSHLGVGSDVPFVVYAPTYRAAHDGSGFDPFDSLAMLAERIGDVAQLGCRSHYLTSALAGRAAALVPVGVTAVTDSLELVVAADLLVTDYSGMAVDAAMAGVPVAILAPDLEVYSRRPGLHVDLPGVFADAFSTDVPGCVSAVRSVLAHPGERLEEQEAWLTGLLGDNAVPGDGARQLADALAPRLGARPDPA